MRREFALGLAFCIYSKLGTLIGFAASPGPFIETQTITLDAPTFLEDFGWSIAADNGLFITGAYGSNNSAGDAVGSGYIYRQSVNGHWNPVAQLLPGDGKDGDGFGQSVGLDGDVAIVGSAFHQVPIRHGAAYIFHRNSDADWQQVGEFVASSDTRFFAMSVDVDGTQAVASGILDVNLGPGVPGKRGTVSIFEETGPSSWKQTQRIGLVDLRTEVRDVALDDGTLIVGTERQPTPGGAFEYTVEVYDDSADGFVHSATLSSPVALDGTGFGFSVALDHDRMLIGAPGESGHGSAYIYERDSIGQWGQAARLTASDFDQTFIFANQVALFGDLAVVASRTSATSNVSNTVYIFQRNSVEQWLEVAKLSRPDELGIFGHSVAVVDGQALIGTGVNAPGAVHVFSQVPEPTSASFGALVIVVIAAFPRLRRCIPPAHPYYVALTQ